METMSLFPISTQRPQKALVVLYHRLFVGCSFICLFVESPAPLHPMDCMDIVVGMVHGDRSRVGDYYTRDRSTPRLDTFYGGSEGLIAAGGKEYDDYTIIKFRKSLTGMQDYPPV